MFKKNVGEGATLNLSENATVFSPGKGWSEKGMFIEYKKNNACENVKWVQFMSYKYQKLLKGGRYGDPIALSVPIVNNIRRQFSGNGNTTYYTDGQNRDKTNYYYDPPNSYSTGNITKNISFIYDRPHLLSVLNEIIDGRGDDIQYNGKTNLTIGVPDPNARIPEIGGELTAVFDDYAINTKNNAILA